MGKEVDGGNVKGRIVGAEKLGTFDGFVKLGKIVGKEFVGFWEGREKVGKFEGVEVTTDSLGKKEGDPMGAMAGWMLGSEQALQVNGQTDLTEESSQNFVFWVISSQSASAESTQPEKIT